MKRETPLPRAPGFWQTVRLLLSVARRRSAGRMSRQQQLLHHRTGSSTDVLSTLGTAMFWAAIAGLHILTAYTVQTAISEAQSAQRELQGKVVARWPSFPEAIRDLENAKTEDERKSAQRDLERAYSWEAKWRTREIGGSEEENEQFLRHTVRTKPASDFVYVDEVQPGISQLNSGGPLPAMFATLILLVWLTVLICQGEGLELDIQRRRHPMWEWLFSHPVKPSAVFLGEMLSPIAANPIYVTGPLFFGVLYGSVYGELHGVLAAILIGIPVSVAAACVGKALEIGIMLRFPPRSRGALIGFMTWIGYAGMLLIFVSVLAMPQFVAVTAGILQPVATANPWSVFSWAIGLKPDGSFSFISGMFACWLASSVMIVGGVGFSVWGAQRGLVASAGAQPIPVRKGFSLINFFKADPLYRKEILWFLRDRGAIVQAVLIPLTIASFQLLNLRMMFQSVKEPWRSVSGVAIVFGTYFLWVLGPRSLASEGQALWLSQTWPRGLEDLMKAKARLWSLIATVIVMLFLIFAMVRFPGHTWKILLIAIGWIAFGRSMAEKCVTLVTTTSSSGEQEPIPRGRRWAASLGMLTFAVGILAGRWELAVIGIVYSWMTAAAMWQNFRARLPFLFDPWSEKVPPAPTLMHAMIAISALVEGGAVVTGFFIFLLGGESIAVVQAIAFAFAAVVVSLVTTSVLENRGVQWRDIWHWRNEHGARGKHFLISLSIGVICGLLLGVLGKGYLMLLSQFAPFEEMLRIAREQFESVPNMRVSYVVIAIAFAPIAEEYLFRGLLYRALDREWGGWRALVGSAAFFAIYHPPLAWLPVFLVGVATALVFKKTKSLTSAIVLHMVYNAVVV